MIISSIISLIIGVYVIKYLGIKGYQGKSALFLTLSIFTWMIGDVMWDLYDDAIISLADIPYMLGYILFGISIFYAIKVVQPKITKKFISGILLTLIILSFIYFKFFPLAWDAESSVIINIVTYGYVILDLLLVFFIVILIGSVFTGSYSNSWIAIGAGAILWLAGDLYYAAIYENYVSGAIMDLTWYYGILLFGLGLLWLKEDNQALLKSIKKP